MQAHHNSNRDGDKSIVDDFFASGYCKCESNLVLRSTEVFAVFLRFVLPYVHTSYDSSVNLVLGGDFLASPRVSQAAHFRQFL